MSRQPSFSRNGMNLDANLHTSIRRKDPSQILKLLKTKPALTKPHRHHHQNPQKPSPLSQTITRQTLSSFQKCHCPVQNVNAIYNEKIQLTKKRRQHYSMKKFVPVSYFETVSEFYRREHDEQQGKTCDKLLKTMRSERFIKTQSQSGLKISDSISKSKLLIPFQKQTERFRQNYLRRLERQALDRPFSPQTQKKKQLTQRQRKMKKTHAFESYESHNLLNPEKVRSFSSAMNIHNVDLKNFKQPNRKSHMKFDKFVDKIATRYDRDSTPWLVKLTYDAKDEVIRGEKGTRKFSKQSSRKMNQVHSKYPMRIAM